MKFGKMSRIGKQPVPIPENVSVFLENSRLRVKGPLGELVQPIPPPLEVEIGEKEIKVKRKSEERKAKALHGLIRSLIFNMVKGVSDGWSRELEIVGVGYKARMEGEKLVLNVGFSHPVVFTPPKGIKLEVKKSRIKVFGIDKALVGQTAAQIRAIRKPEPYKGKGIRYLGEEVRRKPGKAAKVGVGGGK